MIDTPALVVRASGHVADELAKEGPETVTPYELLDELAQLALSVWPRAFASRCQDVTWDTNASGDFAWPVA